MRIIIGVPYSIHDSGDIVPDYIFQVITHNDNVINAIALVRLPESTMLIKTGRLNKPNNKY